jgi:5-methylcytosine-specific restriction endonuclease McrA
MAKHRDAAHAWYGLLRWKKRRWAQLRAHPLCAICLQRSLVTPATVVDHVVPHHGDRRRFESGALQSLCAPCHDSVKRTIEIRGYSTEIGLDGWPTDERHPAWGGKR